MVASTVRYLMENTPGRGNSNCEDPEAGACVVCRRKPIVAGTVRADEGREVMGTDHREPVGHLEGP